MPSLFFQERYQKHMYFYYGPQNIIINALLKLRKCDGKEIANLFFVQ
jgi:hypothetical protein